MSTNFALHIPLFLKSFGYITTLPPLCETLIFAQNKLVAVLLYHIFLRLYGAGVSIVSLFNPKAKLWKQGRKNIFNQLTEKINGTGPVIWMHCASLGEFEQGRPVLESLRKNYPNHKILLTFFSPSGYEIRKNYNGVDWVFYLPLDTPKNVKHFLEIVNPVLAIFVKYEYWYNYLRQLHKGKIPVILISAIFRKDKIFFKWHGGLHRKMLGFFNHIFVQDEESKQLISAIVPATQITIAGDTRFDRVAEIAAGFEPIEAIEKFTDGKKVIVAGSTWPDDEKNLSAAFEKLKEKFVLVIAPHEINDSHINFLQNLFPGSTLFSKLAETQNAQKGKVLIINNIGMLSKLYYYSHISYIGGGFNKSGIHNTLEAAVYGKPVIFGPNYQKFSEAVNLVEKRGGFSYKTSDELIAVIETLLENENQLAQSGYHSGKFVKESTGATNIILDYIKQTFF